MVKNMQVSWVKSEAEYFSIQGWTLICCVARRAQSPDRDASTNRAGSVAITPGPYFSNYRNIH
jgi:hypothetical protein